MKITISTLALIATLTGTALSAEADTLTNLERGRSNLVRTMLDPALSPGDRQGKLSVQSRTLIGLEQQAVRDKTLRGKDTPHVRQIFGNYDASFLVHAAQEGNLSITNHWFSKVIGLTSESIRSARLGRR